MRLRADRLPVLLFAALVYAALLAPLVVVIGASFSAPSTGAVIVSYVEFPPKALTLLWYRSIPASQVNAVILSLALGGVSTIAACLLGVPAAFGLVRGSFPGKPLVATILRAPLQIPAVVTGIAFLQLYYAVEDAIGLGLAGTFLGLAIAHVFIATPFVIGSVAATLHRLNPRLEEAAQSLGASPWRTFRRVTLPMVKPGLFTGALYAFIASFIDVPVSLFLSEPGLVTYPVEIFQAIESDFQPTILASSTVVILISAAALAVVQRLVGLDGLIRSGS